MPEKTEAQKKAQRKYMQGKATIQLVIEPERRDAIKAHAAARGESVNGFIGRAITETMDRDNGGGVVPDMGDTAETPQNALERVSGGGATPIPSGAETPSEAAQTPAEGQ
ncbi:MAG: hypothetical protein IJQ81_16930 [Oscillibacter sp.]|nr:hypothetical protein [Oscillibacter sp.]